VTKYGFVIDHRKCIGCHACTLACEVENDVPLGGFRTWVKYIEKGEFPNTRRYFSIERCQHCEDAPCVEICPTRSLYKRNDGIVDFAPEACIGCKSCMQACPYDALYIDPRSHTAAKCNYCAHRTDRGLLPACVIVCPTKAIIAGDLQDPISEIAETLAREHVQVRRPDQGTRPQVFYVGADETIMTPGLATQPPIYMWSQVGPSTMSLEAKGAVDRRGWQGPANPRFGPDGDPTPSTAASGPLDLGPQGNSGTRAVTAYDVPHPTPWGWKVAAYLWTKSVGGGALMVAGPLLAAGLISPILTLWAPLLAALFTAITAGLLVWDLKRPDRFLKVVLTPNLRSWLPWGSYILIAYGVVATLWLIGGLLGLGNLPRLLIWPGLLLGVGAAGYSAFLFGQCEGRDFWQSPLLLWQLLAGAVLAGAAALVLLGPVVDPANVGLLRTMSAVLLGGVVATLALVLAEVYTLHPNKDVATAAEFIKRGPASGAFWFGVVLVGAALPALALLGVLGLGLPLWVSAIAALLALAGLWIYEDVWIRAGQSVPMS
jgi:Fe-S-cluster-containing dehydrogenase component/formate-dependent nitrite reductase membrane component NrfD